MGWFDEQIKQRKIADEKELDEVFFEIADSVTGENIAKTLADHHEMAIGAIGEIVRYYGCRMVELPTTFSDINDEIEYICRPNGIMRRSCRLVGNWYNDAFNAYLATDKRNGNVVALLPDKWQGKFWYFDAERGEKVRVNRKNAKNFEVDALCFYKPLPLRKLTAKDLFKYAMSSWTIFDIAIPILLILLITGLGLIAPRLNYFLFSEVFESKNISFLFSTIFFLFCISVSRILMSTVHALVAEKNNTKTLIDVEAAIMMRMLSLPASFFKKYSSGEIMQRMAYANDVCGSLVEILFDTGLTSLLSLAYISQIVSYARPLLLPSLCIIGATVIFSLVITLVQIKRTKKILQASAEESGVSYSLITGVQKIKLAGAEKRAFSRWGHRYAKTSDLTYNLPLILKIKPVITLAISSVGTIFLYWIAVESKISVADYYAFETAFAMVASAFLMLINITDSIANIKPTLELIQPILDTVPEVSQGKQLVSRLSGGIELSNVSFRYTENMPFVLNNLSLKIRPGQYVAIVGKTGCGKSTLMRLLLGFEKPQKGAVYYDGKDLANLDLKSLRRNVGTVMQNGKLFQGDVFSNITISAPWLTLDDAWEAAEMAGMADEIRRMPMGMQTLISEGTGGISGGQRQRLMIARAIAPKPNILMFDEATSALDNITQKIVSDSLDSLKCTRIVIAHRLSTIRHCDRIIFLDEGKIVEDGTYDQLIAKNGQFAELVNRQRLDEND